MNNINNLSDILQFWEKINTPGTPENLQYEEEVYYTQYYDDPVDSYEDRRG